MKRNTVSREVDRRARDFLPQTSARYVPQSEQKRQKRLRYMFCLELVFVLLLIPEFQLTISSCTVVFVIPALSSIDPR